MFVALSQAKVGVAGEVFDPLDFYDFFGISLRGKSFLPQNPMKEGSKLELYV